MRREDLEARGDYFDRLDRLREMFVGNPDITDQDIRIEARRKANTFSGGDCNAKPPPSVSPKGD